MENVLHKMTGMVTSVAVLFGTLNCLCASAPASPAATEVSSRHCHHEEAEDSKDSDCRHDKEDHDCQHCQGTLAAEAANGKNLSSFSALSLLPIGWIDALPAILGISATVFDTSTAFRSERPPDIGPPTLLRQHCALTL